ncbi:MAG: amidohydrolase [Rickettsiales bacterium]|nr:amidohydrolase [Rickettsiales bacterium]
MLNRKLEQKIIITLEKEKNNIIQLRRYFHENPEVSGKEYNTQKKILETLKAYGIDGEVCNKTGVVATIRGKNNGKTVAIRADIDALSLQDEIDKPYKSKNDGICHACGHDGHTAALLGISKAFQDSRDELTGNIRLLFQPNEEESGGAEGMVAEGCLDGVTNVIGMHLWQPVEVGKVALTKYMMASVAHFDIKIIGRGGHGSQPQNCVNAVNVASQVVSALNTITSCRIDPREMVVLSVGRFHSGTADNIIPEIATIGGTTRTFSRELLNNVENEIKKMTKGICEANGAACDVEFIYGFPAVINDDEILEIARKVIEERIGKDNTIESKPNLGGEDFSCYLKKVPGVFIFVGAGNEQKGIIHGHHSPRFDLDENGIINGAKILSSVALELLGV